MDKETALLVGLAHVCKYVYLDVSVARYWKARPGYHCSVGAEKHLHYHLKRRTNKSLKRKE